jgi:hypothetical protein
MRGLNLSRIARSSEASHFAEVQQVQARDLRAKLPASKLASAAKAAAAAPTIDTVTAIAAHSAYARVIAATPRATVTAPASPLLARLRPADTRDVRIVQPGSARESFAPDPVIMRTLGKGRFAMYNELREYSGKVATARALPGSNTKAEGALIAAQAFVIATGIVGSIGIGGILYLYFADGVVDRIRRRTVAFRHRVENGPLGQRLKSVSASMTNNGGIMSPETVAAAHEFALKATKADHMNEDITPDEA